MNAPAGTKPQNDSSRERRIKERSREIFDQTYEHVLRRTDRMFGWLMFGQWLFAIGFALLLSPYAWAGRSSSVHPHVYAALLLGGVISSLPWVFIKLRPGAFETRAVVALAQMLWSALLIHLSGGRIETHFHVFGSLAILAFYRDFRVLIPATVVVAADHFFRGLYWPESVYGIANPEWWRFLEHAGWVVFIDVFLFMHCVQGVAELRSAALRQAEVESLSESERDKTVALNRALEELRESQDALVRNERLAAVGQLAASVGHELRNPLAAVRNAHAYMGKKIDAAGGNGKSLVEDERFAQFRGVIDRELDACSKIITDLLDFARARQPARRPCPLAPLVAEAIELVPKRPNVRLVNEVAHDLPVPDLDKDQFRQVFVNLIQNASEAIEVGHEGRVVIRAEADARAFRLHVSDDGPGMAPDVVAKIFQPLYSTKTKGTGLGLAIVHGTIERHGARIAVETAPGRGTTFSVELLRAPAHHAEGAKEAERAHLAG